MPAPRRSRTTELPAPARDLLNTALRLFAQRGYDATSVNDIVAAADVTKGAFYHYFASKDDVLRQIHAEYIDLQLGRLRALRDEPGLRATERLERVIGEIVLSLPEHQQSMAVFLRERRALSAKSLRALKRKRDEWESIFVGFIEEGMRDGEFARIGDARVVAFGIIGMCSWGIEWFDPAGRLSAEDVAAIYAQLALRGLAAEH